MFKHENVQSRFDELFITCFTKIKIMWFICIWWISLQNSKQYLSLWEKMFLPENLWKYLKREHDRQVVTSVSSWKNKGSKMIVNFFNDVKVRENIFSHWTCISSSCSFPSSSCWATGGELCPFSPGWPTGTSGPEKSPSVYSRKTPPGFDRPEPPLSLAAQRRGRKG